MSRSLPMLAILAFVVAITPLEADAQQRRLSLTRNHIHEASLSQLRETLTNIDHSLAPLATLSLRTGIGAIGYRSERYRESGNTDWIQIDLGQTHNIDEIVLVPTIWRDAHVGFRADGFPLEFHVLVGGETSDQGEIVARFGPEDALLPRLAPLVMECPEKTRGSWVRVVATSLGPRLWDGRHDLQLSEIMVFSGVENIALHSQIEVSSSDVETNSINKNFLVDGFVPYLMDANAGQRSIAFVSPVKSDVRPELILDLKEVTSIDRVHLHAVDTSDTAPQSTGTDFAVPRELQVLGANSPDLSDAKELCTIKINSIYDSGPIMMRRFDSVPCRFVAFIARKPFIENAGKAYIGFAEIEVFSHGKNVARNRRIEANFDHRRRGRRLASLTDGRNFYGNILSIRDWMTQLSKRHELETVRSRVVDELAGRYEQQEKQLRLARWGIGGLAVAIGLWVLVNRLVRARELARIKERFAADMHDELGANLHTIGLLTDLAFESKQSSTELNDYLTRIRSITERTGTAMRQLVDTRVAQTLYTRFVTDMEEAAEKIVVKLEHELEVTGEEFLNQLNPSARADLLLFYKECLVNISRHSGATQLQTHLEGSEHEVRLRVSDNGKGLSNTDICVAPPSLVRRARLLGARVRVTVPENKGTQIDLLFRTKPRWKWW